MSFHELNELLKTVTLALGIYAHIVTLKRSKTAKKTAKGIRAFRAL